MIPSFGSVLLIESDRAGARRIAKALIRSGFSVKVSEDLEAALALVRACDFDAIVLDSASWTDAREDLTRWISDSNAADRVALLGQDAMASGLREASGLGPNVVFTDASDMQALSSFIRASARRKSQPECFTGKAEEIDLLSYLQFLVLDRMKTVLEVSSFDGAHGEIFIDGGEILHARFGSLQGEDALFQCLAFKAGSFAHKPWHPPEIATIRRPADSLLFEAARIRDESKPDPRNPDAAYPTSYLHGTTERRMPLKRPIV